MECKTVTLISVLIMSLVLAHIQVEAKVCCPSPKMRNLYDACVEKLHRPVICATPYNCMFATDKCPPRFPYYTHRNSGDIVNEYCKLGCTSFVCGALTTLHNSDASEIVNGAVGQCINACSTLCTKGSKTALETA